MHASPNVYNVNSNASQSYSRKAEITPHVAEEIFSFEHNNAINSADLAKLWRKLPTDAIRNYCGRIMWQSTTELANST